MADLWVHVRMKRCCRQQLEKLDRARVYLKKEPGVGAVPQLASTLGEMPMPEALAQIDDEALTHAPSAVEQRVYKTCTELCRQHAAVHEGSEEGDFWSRAQEIFAQAEAPRDAKDKGSVQADRKPFLIAPVTRPVAKR